MVAEMGPDPEHHHHHPTGHRWLDMVLAVSAVVISLMSLFLAIQHGRVMERMVEASTWPYVSMGTSTANPDGTRHISVWVVNKGVGPARVDSLEVFYQGVAQPDPNGLLKAIVKPSDPARKFSVLQSDVIDNVLSAKESVNIIDLPPKDYDPAEYVRISRSISELEFRVCYCSVFEECSIMDTRKSPHPFAVKACVKPSQPFLH